jgi:hypothetical protein
VDGRVSAGNREDGQGPKSCNQSAKHVSYLDGVNRCLSENQPKGRHGDTEIIVFSPRRRLSVSPRHSLLLTPAESKVAISL